MDTYFIIQLPSLIIDDMLDFNLYLKSGTEYVLYRSSLLKFGIENKQKLLENDINELYVLEEDLSKYQKYVEHNIKNLLQDDSIEENTKAAIVYDSVKLAIKDLFKNPTNKVNIKRSQVLVDSVIFFIFQGRNPITNLMDVMSFDYTTYTHSINVAILSISLGNHIGIKNAQNLVDLGTGALLHDIGKTKIPNEVLEKKTPLTDSEIKLIRQHPEVGYKLLKKTNLLSEHTLIPVLQHHERDDGSGYPNNLKADEIHLHSKIVGIADVFDAMTTNKIYRPAHNAFPALQEMFGEEEHFDKELLRNFTKMLGQKKEEE